MSKKLLEAKKRELELKKAQKKIEHELPHLYGHKLYKWQRKFIDSVNKVNLLTAANQIGKSSAGIRRCITNATDMERWEKLWGHNARPKMFWYFYPDQETLEKEYATKWTEWLPRGDMKKDSKYGWTDVMDRKVPKSIHFNSGVIVYFQYYTKKVSAVQAGSVHEVYCDEEMPMAFYDELMMRMIATNGIFNSMFTPTLNQPFWKKAMDSNKILPHALKLCVSMYDCLTYEDGTPSTAFTLAKIEEAKSKCKNETEIQRRIYGKFVTEEGRTFYSFDFEKHVVPRYDISNWLIYSSCDYGSGGSTGHPSAITFLAVRPDMRKGVFFKSWRGDNIKTTQGDLFNRHQAMCISLPYPPVENCYDPAAADFGTIAIRNAVNFTKANKARDSGVEMMNTLFHHGMLEIFDDDLHNMNLATELIHIMEDNQQSENKSGDDLADSARYNIMQVPWDLSVIQDAVKKAVEEEKEKIRARPMTEEEAMAQQIKERRGDFGQKTEEQEAWNEIDDDIEYWNEQFGT